ncbi:hypothetical protein DRJ22_04970 [Candidatus Woesearchaeota archaeon]|nr:MAG: hypothetical protein DRJ22_04970 [Candidatus Woesearchaeota archaeon]
MALEIIGQEPISMADLKAELEQTKKRDKELGFRAQKTLDYLNQFSKLGTETAKELLEKLEKLKIPRLKNKHYCKILDIMPTDPKEVKLILQGYNVTISNEACKKITDLITKYIA